MQDDSTLPRDRALYTWRSGPETFLAHAVPLSGKWMAVCGTEFESRPPTVEGAEGKPKCSVCDDVLSGALRQGIY